MTQTATELTEPQKKRRKAAFKRHYFAFPYMVLAVIFTIIPLCLLLGYAFRSDLDGSFTLSNFTDFFTRPGVLLTMLESLWIASLTTFFCLLIAYPLAMVLANSKFNKSMILVLMFVLPMYINSLLRTYAIKSVFDMMGITAPYFRLISALVFDFFPFMLLPVYTVLVNMDKSYAEASGDLGGNPLKTFLKVTLPLSSKGIVSGILMVFMPTVSTFTISKIVVNKSYLFGNLIDDQFNAKAYGAASAYSFILLVLILATVVIAGRINAVKQRQTGGVS